ncbi:prepilin-type N-terminal cleavage/methylation domain-containing protein [Clostridium botulinum]|uniref:prepilin-type N-terminal cleavage/methylation domain-containing protein n=1 Tax=Clostridium botulinum TaxID=1491 RepID=UPI001C9A2E1E|nr:prepilin-type N-terminal cleavage/methylation domain-containing protein [Clostridium botulinum]MBY6809994.1 prepilin-type N-terminal cleavage/methylation domain-containing protein [Clostridium botulinum]MBY6823650.1 prepilin-type N-terminal cleavage/methylation domain-containing protein [Clostridium botulinum]MBY6834261.1 prepilin-type N-terminal cleavage/methylation domain-containing protein [Clostridium botulinum]MBY6972608.1 prepilin-type N-terminal cleavage/methylation domain-containing 
MNKLSIKSMSNQISKKKKKGFTLVELIIVIAIIAILAAMAIPKFGQVRQDAKVSNDIGTAKNIQTATAMLIGNGTIKEGDFETAKAPTKEIIDRIDGKTTPTADNVTDKNFNIQVVDGNIIVTVDGYQLAPQLEADVANGNKATSGYGKKTKE